MTARLTMAGVALAALAALLLGAVHAVDNSLTAEDREYIARFTAGVEQPAQDAKYAEQLAYIRAVQGAVLRVAPDNAPLPFGRGR